MTTEQDSEYWETLWAKDTIGFHESEVNPILIKYMNDLTAGEEKCRIFVPLCGKSVDMKWLAERGHTVVGAELCSIAILDFFKENNIEYSSTTVKGLNDSDVELYTSKDSRILLYQGNLFDLNRDIMGEFDCIWDRASLVALMREDLQRYVDLMTAIVKPNGRCLLATLQYEPENKMKPPPFCTPSDTVDKLYAANWDMKFLQVTDGMNEKWRKRGLNVFTNRADLLTKKEK